MKMPGFRPGKIPRKILEKQVPVQSFTNMFQELLQEYYEKALRKSGIVPAGTPEIDNSDFQDVKTNSPLKFSVTLDIKPEVKIKDYKGLKMKKLEINLPDQEVDVRRQVQRAIQANDVHVLLECEQPDDYKVLRPPTPGAAARARAESNFLPVVTAGVCQPAEIQFPCC